VSIRRLIVTNMALGTFPSKSVQRLVLSRQHLTEETLGQNEEDVITIAVDIGGLHAQSLESPYFSLWNRMKNFEWEWLDHLLSQRKLIAAHLMRVTLHIVPAKEFPIYFQATRDAIRRFLKVRGVSWPPKLTETHQAILNFLGEKTGGATTLDIRKFLESKALPTENLHRIVHYELAGMGMILRSERRADLPTQWTWSPIERLIDKSSLEGITEEEAKEWLVEKYLKAFGPSSIADIISYTWHTRIETEKIIERLVAKGKVAGIKIDDQGKHWTLSEDLGRLKELKVEEDTAEKFSNVRVLPEFDPLTIGYRKRWRRLISVPPVRFGLRPHPAPGVILVNGQVFGTYLTWPHFALFFNAQDVDRKTIEEILKKFEEMARLKGTTVFCIEKINGKKITTKDLKTIFSYLRDLGYSMRDERLCKQLS